MTTRLRQVVPFLALATASAALIGVACGNDRLRRATEAVEAVPGDPSVSSGLPAVDRLDGGFDGAVYGPAAPFQIDSFTQQKVQKVDILWIIDNSPSMKPKQDRLKQNFKSFIQFLSQQSIDYHLGVTTTDTYDPTQSGRLVNFAGLPQPFIDNTTPAPEAAFVTNASVGVGGTGDEKGLLGGMLALTPPLSPAIPALPATGAANCGHDLDGGPSCFLRPDAPLYTVLISDEDDSSCTPIQASTEGCTEGDIHSQNGYGSVDYWSRFYSGIKGAGGTSRLAAITSVDATPHNCADVFPHYCDQDIANAGGCANVNDCANNLSSACCQAIFNTCYHRLFDVDQFCSVTEVTQNGKLVSPYYQVQGSWNGCIATNPVDGGVEFTAYAGSRYATVAENTGGVATSICDDDYTPALEKLGLQASGLRRDFPLSRAPISTSLVVLVNNVPVASGANTWQYVGCEVPTPPGPGPHTPINAVRFTTPPQPGNTVAASYDVNVRGLTPCP